MVFAHSIEKILSNCRVPTVKAEAHLGEVWVPHADMSLLMYVCANSVFEIHPDVFYFKIWC